MNDHELARHLAVTAGNLLSGLRQHAQSIDAENDESLLALAREVLGKAGDGAGHDYLTSELATLRPDDEVLSEEGDGTDLARLGAQRVWIVDPLDGTSEYSSHRIDYAVHVALWDKSSTMPSKLIASSVAIPELGVVWSMDDVPVSPPSENRPIRILVSRSRPPREIEVISANLTEAFPERGVEVVPMGSAGAKVGHILAGEADMYINTGGFYEWDLAAPLGVAVHHGLRVFDIHGADFTFNNPNLKLTGAIVTRPEFESIILTSIA
jgi:3'(2'), 5'-bisphosphate nucleotidase